MSFALPANDPQFWAVTAAALAALVFFVRKKFRFKRKGEVDLPCDHCSQAKSHRDRFRPGSGAASASERPRRG